MAPETDRERRLDEVLADYLDAVAAGRAPDRQQLLARNADLADELTAFFRDQDRVEGVMAPLRVVPPATMIYPAASAAAGEPLGPGSRFGDYEIVEVIARSGMGVVYKAWQLLGQALGAVSDGAPAPARIVALKMIRAGRWASAADVQRFQLEAEAAASLDHPNIVPIYDVGVHEGQPYLSMKLYESGSLAQRTAGQPQPPRDAARLVAMVARAVDFAHQRGILHRDLKPANVLLDSEGRPYLTDFGLAKWVDREQDLTPSGITVGTPSYMAPEQAFPARSGTGASPKAVGLTTRADVYGLGAVLFEMLTGRPPFKGATPLDTLLEVLEKPAAAPRGLAPTLDRDLEIVCLKCLEKDPARRYATAAELADDLERYVRGEPISARPSGMLERAWRRVKRQPVVFTLLLAFVLALVGGVAAVTWQWRRAENNLIEREKERERAENNLIEKERQRKRAEEKSTEADEQRKKAELEFRSFSNAVADFCQRAAFSGRAESNSVPALKRSLFTAAVPHFEGFVARRGHDPAIEGNLALTYLFLSELHQEAEHFEEALRLNTKARDVLEWLLANHPKDQHRQNLATAYFRIGAMLEDKGKRDDAARNFERTCELLEPLCNGPKPELEDLRLQAKAWNALGYYHADAKRHAPSEECWGHCVTIDKRLTEMEPANLENTARLANAILNVAHARGNQGRREEAYATYKEAVKTFQPLLATTNPIAWHINAHNALENKAKNGPGRQAMLAEIAASHRRVGHAWRHAKKYNDALLRYRQAENAAGEWLSKDGASVEAHNELARCHYDQAVVYDALREPEEALRHLETARDLRLPLVEREPQRRNLRHDLGLTLSFLGSVYADVGRYEDARAALRDGAEQYRLALEGAGADAPSRASLAGNLLGQAEQARKSGRLADADTALTERRRLLREQPQELYVTAREYAALALFATGGKARPSAEEGAARQRYGALAVETLKQAVAAGYKDLAGVRKDAAFAPLRRLPEFNALLSKP
jgi:serine/threonine-protein kinase